MCAYDCHDDTPEINQNISQYTSFLEEHCKYKLETLAFIIYFLIIY